MRKRLTIATCATLAVALTGALAAQMFRPNASAVIEDRNGHQWHIRSNFPNQVKLYDQAGNLVGIAGNHQHTSGSAAVVEVDVEGAHYQLHPGKQEICDGKGTLIGFAEMIPVTDSAPPHRPLNKLILLINTLRQSEEEEAKYGGVSGISASPIGAHGWNKALKMDWRIRGSVKVRVLDMSGHAIGAAQGVPLTAKLRQELGAYVPPAVPILNITINGKTHQKRGYGKYDIKNETGKTLFCLDVQPLTPTPETTSDPVSNAPAPVH